MSAICGIFHLKNGLVDPKDIKRCMVSMKHRAANGQSFQCKDSIALGFLQLNVTPFDGYEEQPFVSGDGSLSIVSESRLDNRKELYEALDIQEKHQKYMPDSVILLLAFHQWGEQCTEHLLGEFAFAIWDNSHKKLFCARDAMGLRCLYYYYGSDYFVFATEVKAVLSHPSVPKTFDKLKIAEYLLGIELKDIQKTYFDAICKLPAGTQLSVSKDHFFLDCFWFPDIKNKVRFETDKEYYGEYKKKLTSSIKHNLKTKHKIGLLFSGGFNSAILAFYALCKTQKKEEKLDLFASLLADDFVEPELELFELMAAFHEKFNKTHLNYYHENADDVIADINAQMWLHSGPLQPHYYIYNNLIELAEQCNVKVLLGGLDAMHKTSAYGDGYLSGMMRKGHLIKALKEVNKLCQSKNLSFWQLLKAEVLNPLMPDFVWNTQYRPAKKDKPLWQTHSMIAAKLGKKLNMNQVMRHTIDGYQYRTMSTLNKNNLKSTEKRLAGESVEELVLIASAKKITVVQPFLEQKFVEYCLSIPDKYHYLDGEDHHLQRQSFFKILPDKLLQTHETKESINLGYYEYVYHSVSKFIELLESLDEQDAVNVYVDLDKIKKSLEVIEKLDEVKFDEKFKQQIDIVMRGFHMACFISWMTKTNSTK
ncbi:MAG: hypothetical protein HON94_07700 [Methylococcales bacterium]|nr:hypothetical protein [Methylococcales bacterium]